MRTRCKGQVLSECEAGSDSGYALSTVRDAIMWSGSSATLSLFVITKSKVAPSFELAWMEYRPELIRLFNIEDQADVLSGRRVFEYDSHFDTVPEILEDYLTFCLRNAMISGAECAWFGFEGSFDFSYLLAPEISAHIYALADSVGILVACDDGLRLSKLWRDRVVEARDRILGAKPKSTEGF